MIQVYEHYEKWEDYKAGMYVIRDLKDVDNKINLGVILLSEADLFYHTMTELIDEWPVCSAVNLTNLQQNRRAWLGAAACMYKYKIEEVLTRQSWAILPDNQKAIANKKAEEIIKEYENRTNHQKDLFTNVCF